MSDARTKRVQIVEEDGRRVLVIPDEFQLEGPWVKLTWDGARILIESLPFDVASWLADLDANHDPDFMKNGREQPEMPADGEPWDFI